MIGFHRTINGISVIDFDIKNNVNGLQNFFNKGFTVNNTSCVLTPWGISSLFQDKLKAS